MQQRVIMVVEDERPIAENIIFALEAERYVVRWKSSAAAALEAMRSEQPDFFILDINLPDMTGFDLCREIRRETNRPVLFLSARQEEIDRIIALEIGGDDYLMKPFSLRELTARVKAILRRSETAPAQGSQPTAPIPLVVDERRGRVEYFGTKVPLSKYEFFILKILAAKPGWVFSREQLIDHTMGELSAPYDRTIDAHIKSIRAKLRKIRAEPEAIETHRGFGYALRETW